MAPPPTQSNGAGGKAREVEVRGELTADDAPEEQVTAVTQAEPNELAESTPHASTGRTDEERAPPPPNFSVTRAEQVRRWIHGRLRGHDNRMAKLRSVTIARVGQGYRIHIANQFGFRCDVEFDAAGNPVALLGCKSSGADNEGWFARPDRIALDCQQSGPNQTCTGHYTLGKGEYGDRARLVFFRRADENPKPPPAEVLFPLTQ